MSELTTPLQSLISQAAKAVPRETGETEPYRRRLETAGSSVVILADTSGSMAESAGAKRKIDHLHDALDSVMDDAAGVVGIEFNCAPREFSRGERFAPSGGTALDLALEAAAAHRPAVTIVVSDGRPNDEGTALAAAEKLPGRIDVIYCGPDSDAQAVNFMRRLARVGCGTCVVRDLVRLGSARPALTGTLRKLVGLPAPEGD